MKAIVNTSLLKDEFAKMSSIVNKNTVLPILQCVKLDFQKGRLTIISSDLETTYSSSIDCECGKPFTIVVDFASILDVCKNLNEPITIEESGKTILITGDDSKFKLPIGGAVSEFPKIPEETFLFTVDVDQDFFSALFRADSCKNPNDLMVNMSTACLDFKKNGLTIAGTDGFYLYKKDTKIKSGVVCQSLIGSKFVHIVSKYDHGKLSIGEKFARIERNNTVVVTRLQDAKFVNYESVLIKDIVYNLKVVKSDLIHAISKVLIAANKAVNLCVLNFKDGNISISSHDRDFEKEGETNIKAIHTVEIDSIGVPGKRLIHALNLFDSDEVDISIRTATQSLYLKDSEDPSALCLLQPLVL